MSHGSDDAAVHVLERLDTLLSYCRRACFHADLLLRSTQDLVVGKLTGWAAEPIPSVRSEISERAEDSHGNSLSFGDSTYGSR